MALKVNAATIEGDDNTTFFIGNLPFGTITGPTPKKALFWLELGWPGANFHYKHHYSSRDRAMERAKEMLTAIVKDLEAS